MRSTYRTSIFFVTVLLNTWTCSTQETAAFKGHTPAEILQERGIGVTRPELINALHNGDPQIRVLAAMELQAQRDSDARPVIEGALLDEKDVSAGIAMATVLLAMRDEYGEAYLKRVCSDKGVDAKILVRALQAMQTTATSSSECALNLLEALRDDAKADYWDVLISLLPEMIKQGAVEPVHAVNSLGAILDDRRQQPAVRVQAAQALAEIGSPSGAAELRQAISGEDDSTLKGAFENSLRFLESKLDQKPWKASIP